MTMREAGKRRVVSITRSLLIVIAVLSGPAWFRYTANASCNYQCGLGKYVSTTSFNDSACADQGGVCYQKTCGGNCKNHHGQACSWGQFLPPNCVQGNYWIQGCEDTTYMIPCGCDYFCSQ